MKGTIRRRLGGLATAVLAASLWVPLDARAENKLLESRESRYNTIYVYEEGNIRTLLFGHNRRMFTESEYDKTNDMHLPVAYTRVMTTALAYATGHADILEIGFGAGRTSWYLYKSLPDTRVTSVELDPDVAELAKKYFGISEQDRYTVAISDGRRYIMHQPEGSYDIILVDAYRGPFVPFHLLTREFFTEAKKRLRPGGAMAQNVDPSTMVFDSAVATIRSVFDHVDLYESDGNIVLIAYDGPAKDRSTLLEQAAQLQTRYALGYPLDPYLQQRRVIDQPSRTEPLTDDFAPVEALRAIEVHNRKLDEISRPGP